MVLAAREDYSIFLGRLKHFNVIKSYVLNQGFQRFDTGAACVIALVLFAMSMVFAAMLMRRGNGFLSMDD